jgi:hypothetical protein
LNAKLAISPQKRITAYVLSRDFADFGSYFADFGS